MKPLQAINLILLALITSMLWGCSSDKLTRGKAAEILKSSINFPRIESLDISNTYAVGTDGAVAKNFAGGPETKEMHDFFLKKKLMTIARKWDQGNGYWSNIVTGFTDEGKKYAIRIEEQQAFSTHTIKLCDIVFNEITGIQINEQTKIATVEFSLKRTNWTPFGEYYKEKEPSKYPEIIVGQRATLQKYDDGWRMGTVESN